MQGDQVEEAFGNKQMKDGLVWNKVVSIKEGKIMDYGWTYISNPRGTNARVNKALDRKPQITAEYEVCFY